MQWVQMCWACVQQKWGIWPEKDQQMLLHPQCATLPHPLPLDAAPDLRFVNKTQHTRSRRAASMLPSARWPQALRSSRFSSPWAAHGTLVSRSRTGLSSAADSTSESPSCPFILHSADAAQWTWWHISRRAVWSSGQSLMPSAKSSTMNGTHLHPL